MLFQRPEFFAHLAARLQNGEHLVLYGPRGSGKSTVLAELEKHLNRIGVPCGYSSATTSLEAITRALARAYPSVQTREVAARIARWRLWSAADTHRGVILLDHLSCVSNAMVSFLRRRLHGGVVGALSAVEVDDERERKQMKPWRIGALSLRMPLASRRQLRRLLLVRWQRSGVPQLESHQEDQFVDAARGRPGWIVQCSGLACDERYWANGRLLLTVLSTDTEALVRYGNLDLFRPVAAAREQTEGHGSAVP